MIADEALERDLELAGIVSSTRQREQWLRLLDLIRQWNRVDNLTSVDDLEKMRTVHLLDSLSIAEYLSGQHVLDVGSGAGLPGLPLAIAHPDKQFTLLDAAAKRVRFQRHATLTLGLDNVETIQSRIEGYQPVQGFDVILSRAFSSLAHFASATIDLLNPRGTLLAMKGRYPQEELAALSEKFKYTVIPLKVPGLGAERHLVSISSAHND